MRRIVECMFILILLLSRLTSAQAGEQFRTLVINDQSGKVAVLEMGDKTYIELKQIAQIAHGSITYQGNRILLDLSCPEANVRAATTEKESTDDSRLTREFVKAGIEEISLMREWASSLASAVQNGFPVTDSWVAGYRGHAQTGLAAASAAVSSGADRSAFQLLNREFENVREWSNKLLEARKSMSAANYALSSGALANDPLSQKIVGCAHFLGQMLASGNFQDDSACH